MFWVDCSSEENIRKGFRTISTRCRWPIDDKDDLGGARDQLAGCGRPLLLILDNCDDAGVDYSRFIPSGAQTIVLMTTRLSDARKYATSNVQNKKDKHFERMEGLEEEAAVDLLLERSATDDDAGGSRSEAAKVVNILDRHPLAIIVAGSLVRGRIFSLTELLQDLETRFMQKELLDTPNEQTRYKKISATFEVSAQYLVHLAKAEDEVAEDALELLDLLSFLYRRNVSEDIFTRAWQEAEIIAERSSSGGNPGIDHLSLWHVTKCQGFLHSRPQDKRHLAFRRARSYLVQLSLVTLHGDRNAISCHALVHSWARERVVRQHEKLLLSASILALSAAGRETWEPYTPALAQQCEASFTLQESDSAFLLPCDRMEICRIWYVYATQMLLTRSDHTMKLCRRLETVTKNLVQDGTDELYIIDAQYLLVMACRANAEVSESLSLMNHVVKVKTKLPEDNQSRLASQHELACAYEAVGRPQEAVTLLEDVVRVLKNEAEDDPTRLTYEHSLGGAYQANGQLDKAVPLLERVNRMNERLSKDNPNRLASQYALASAYKANRQAHRAVQLLEDVVQVREGLLPKTHPSLLDSQHALADAHRANGQVEKAVTLLEHVAGLRNTCLHPNHPSRIKSQQLLDSLISERKQSAKDVTFILQYLLQNQNTFRLKVVALCLLLPLLLASRFVDKTIQK